MNRRGFIKGVLAGSVTVPPAPGEPITPMTTIVIHDPRYTDARVFALQSARMGAVVRESQLDVARLWYEKNMDGHLAENDIRLMGMTAYADYLSIQSCMKGCEYKVIFEGFHDCRGAAYLTHKLRYHGCGSLSFPFQGRQWPATLARILFDMERGGPSELETVIRSTTRRAPDHPGTLVSWLVRSGARI